MKKSSSPSPFTSPTVTKGPSVDSIFGINRSRSKSTNSFSWWTKSRPTCAVTSLNGGGWADGRHATRATIRAIDGDRFECVDPANTEWQRVVHARLKAASRLQLLHKLAVAAVQGDARTDGERIRAIAFEADLQVVIGGELCAGVVPIDERFVVHVVYDEIRRAVAIQIPVCRAVRETRQVNAPGCTHLRERQIAVVAKCIVAELGRSHGLDQAHEIHALPARRGKHRLVVAEEGDVVL